MADPRFLSQGRGSCPGRVVAWTIKRPTSVPVSVSVSAFVRFRKVYLCLTTTECKYKFTFLNSNSSEKLVLELSCVGSTYLPPATKLRQGYVLTPVCQSFCSQGGGVWHTHTPPGQTPPGQTPPGADTHRPVHAGIHTPSPVHAGIHTPLVQCMLGYGQQVGGTHPTGMHSCLTEKSSHGPDNRSNRTWAGL